MVFKLNNKTSRELLYLLADGSFHSGQELGRKLGITRSGIWKALRKLEDVGIELHAVTGKGYRIPQGLDLLDKNKINLAIKSEHKAALKEIVVLSVVDSTNDYLLRLVKNYVDVNVACVAEYQEGGRGTSGRCWLGGYASGIYLSLLWHFSKDPGEIIGLSLAIGVAVLRALKRYSLVNGFELKWPNDILFNRKKLAGILIDMLGEKHSNCSAVIGIGINCAIPSKIAETITKPCIDLATITRFPVNRNRLTAFLLDELINSLIIFSDQGLTPFLAEWHEYDYMVGKTVSVASRQTIVHGIMQGVSRHGELIVKVQDDDIRYLLTGELSLQ